MKLFRSYAALAGGVVNTITKSGGNVFSGLPRDSMTNPTWTEETPGAAPYTDVLNQVWEATLGGFVVHDRLWFFGAGRDTETATPRSLRRVPGSTELPVQRNQIDTETRMEGRLTGQITSKHNLSASYLDVTAKSQNSRFTGTSYDEAQFSDREDPQSLLSVFYNGVLTNNLMVEARYAEMEWGVGWGSGSPFTDVIRGTIVRNRADSNAAVEVEAPPGNWRRLFLSEGRPPPPTLRAARFAIPNLCEFLPALRDS